MASRLRHTAKQRVHEFVVQVVGLWLTLVSVEAGELLLREGDLAFPSEGVKGDACRIFAFELLIELPGRRYGFEF